MCRVLDIQPSRFYRWQNQLSTKNEKDDQDLREEITIIYENSRKAYGSPRVHASLKLTKKKIGRNRVARLMKQMGLRSRRPGGHKVTTTKADPDHAPAPNLVNRRFKVEKPNQLWLSDLTYISTKEGWLYVAGVMDACSRKIIGFAMDENMGSSLAQRALISALKSRPRDKSAELVHHSDRGSQYTSQEYQKILKHNEIKCSMSRKGDCWDNAMKESFWATLKGELVADAHFQSRQQARSFIFEFINHYNRNRLHSALDYRSPDCYEQGLS